MSRNRISVGLVGLCLALGLVISPAFGGYYSGPASGDYSFFTTPTAWEPGTNSARVGGHPSPGGATFSIMDAGFVDVSGSDTKHGANTTQLITTLGVPGFGVADYAAVINWGLNVWAGASMFTNLGQVADGGVNAGASQATGGHLGDIRVAAWELTASATLAHAWQPGTEAIFGAGGTISGDLHFDVNRTWEDDPTDTAGGGDYDIYTVGLHELGHSLGLGHSDVVGSVMEPTYAGARRSLHADDIAGIQALYGVPEPVTVVLLAFGGVLLVFRRRRHVA